MQSPVKSVDEPVRVQPAKGEPTFGHRRWGADRKPSAGWRSGLETSPGERQLLAIIILVGLAAYALAARMRLLHSSPAGDEPAYLVLSQAMERYHSLDVMRVHANGDYRSFYPAFLQPHVVPGVDGQPEPLHQIGGPLLWLIPFMLWERAGAVGFMVVVSVLTLVNIYHFLRERRIDAPYAFVITLAMAIGSPIYVLSAMSFVEPIGTLAIIFAVRAVLIQRLHPVRLVVASVGLALAPWVHMRFAPTSLILGLLLVHRVWRDHRRRAAWPYVQCLAPLLLSVVLIEIYTILLYGSVNPMAPQSIFGVSVFEVPLYKGFAGTLFDRNYGLIDNFPLFLLVLPGLLLALRREYLRTNLVLLAVIVPYLVLSCTSTTWWGAYTPPARYISVIVPLIALYMAVLLQRVNAWFTTGAAVLLGAAGYALGVCSDIFPSDRFTGWDKRNDGMERLGRLVGFDFVRWAPSSFEAGQSRLFLGWTLATLGVGLVFWVAGVRSDLGRLIRRRTAPLTTSTGSPSRSADSK